MRRSFIDRAVRGRREAWWGTMLCVGLAAACDVYDGKLIDVHASAGDREASSLRLGGADGACRFDDDAGSMCSRDCPEVCNGRDDDCDGTIDEEDASSTCQLSHGAAICIRGACVLAVCERGYLDCDQRSDNGCEVAPDDAEHCGTCDQRCSLEHASAQCHDGECRVDECDDGFADCDGDGLSCESDLSEPEHCGACGTRCPGGCSDGRCDEVDTDCSDVPGHSDCDHDHVSCETDLRSDVDHCGSCQSVCRFTSNTPHATLACLSRHCHAVCDAGFGDCDGNYQNGCEQALNTQQHCGTCDESCDYAHADSACVDGVCRRSACEADYADCDGDGTSCEQSLVDRQTCGSCDTLCRLPHALGACSRSETDGSTRCDVASCNSGFGNCDGVSGNGCERDTRKVADGGQGPCVPAPGCIPYTYQSHTYYVCPLLKRWADARATCQTQLRGDLVTIGRAEVDAFLETRVATRLWVGANSQKIPGLWVWAGNGVPFWQGGVNGMTIHNRYVNWESGEPSGSGSCISMLNTGTLADESCSDLRPFICEVSPDSCPDDPDKSDPGQCGCGQADTDASGDGIAECLH